VKSFADFNKRSGDKAMGLQSACRECQRINFLRWSHNAAKAKRPAA
jgi:hypothetical protein